MYSYQNSTKRSVVFFIDIIGFEFFNKEKQGKIEKAIYTVCENSAF
jgi:hypothetical protein